MPNVTNKKSRKRASIICAVIIVAVLATFLATILYPLLDISYGAIIAVGIIAIFSLSIIIVIIGVLAALRQRLKEIEGGEEEIAKRY